MTKYKTTVSCLAQSCGFTTDSETGNKVVVGTVVGKAREDYVIFSPDTEASAPSAIQFLHDVNQVIFSVPMGVLTPAVDENCTVIDSQKAQAKNYRSASYVSGRGPDAISRGGLKVGDKVFREVVWASGPPSKKGGVVVGVDQGGCAIIKVPRLRVNQNNEEHGDLGHPMWPVIRAD